MDGFLNDYFTGYKTTLDAFLTLSENRKALQHAVEMLESLKGTPSTIYIIGNGGSAAVAEHMATDFTQNAKLRALAISGVPMLTCWSNDYGYEHCFRKAIQSFGRKDDILIAISSSGGSKSIINACIEAKKMGIKLVTLSGFAADNPLRNMGDINFWVDSRAFGYVELIHNLLLHYINDAVIGKIEYMIRD